MNIIFDILLFLHIIGGSLGLLSGMLNILLKKGDKKHQMIGRIFFFAMITSGLSSLALAYLHPNYFLFIVGCFTLYMVFSGKYYLRYKLHDKPDFRTSAWIAPILMLIVGLVFIGIGFLSILKSNLFGAVFITFGIIGIFFVRQDFLNFTNKTKIKNYWLIEHLQRMIGGFIAALTAFLVVNAKYLPEQISGLVYWLLPTVILTPLIVFWSKKYTINKND